jgi:glycine/D-amino acid oxidase-like deaminating enzyme
MPQLFPEILSDVIHATRQEVFFFGVPAGDVRFSSPAMPPWIDFQGEFYGVPDIEHRGFKVALDRYGPRIDPNTEERRITSEMLGLVREHLPTDFPALANAPLIESRVCQYEISPNGDFLIDRHPELENIWFVGGGSGHGFKHGPAVGEYVASVLTGDVELEPRFLLSSKNIGRKRSIY